MSVTLEKLERTGTVPNTNRVGVRAPSPEPVRTETVIEIPAIALAPEAPVVEARDDIDNAVIKAIRVKKRRRKFKASLTFKIMILFAIGLLVVLRYASITELGYKVSDAKSRYEEIVGENERIAAQIESSMNINELTTVAKEKFGMQRPQTYQMVMLDVKSSDQTEYYDIELKEAQDTRPWYTIVIDAVKDFIGIV